MAVAAAVAVKHGHPLHYNKKRLTRLGEPFFLYLLIKTFGAVFADKLSFVFDKIFVLAADNAVGLVLFQNNLVAIYKDFNGVLFCQSKGSSDFNGENDSAEFIEFANDAGGFHFPSLPSRARAMAARKLI